MSPTRIALARVLRAWLEWPGVAAEDRFSEADTLRYVGDAILRADLAIPHACDSTTTGRALLEELDQHEKGGAP